MNYKDRQIFPPPVYEPCVWHAHKLKRSAQLKESRQTVGMQENLLVNTISLVA